MKALSGSCPELTDFLTSNPAGQLTIDFSDSSAVLCLNKALLAHFYNVSFWQIPAGYLCPPIPGRADYIHYLADLLADRNQGIIPEGKSIKALDIGTGANCIYPIIGSQIYDWSFTATDIDPVSVKAARLIVEGNTCLKNQIRIVQQRNQNHIFHGIIKANDRFDVTLCNPPFHASMAEAQAGSLRKWNNLKGGKSQSNNLKDKRNFGGQKAELWCKGGEIRFLKQMARESRDFAEQVGIFTSLVSKKENLRPLEKLLKQLGATNIQIIKMSQGQKISHLLAWSYEGRLLLESY
ncbi:23S rRNA (adenine(1618)-N(6))-methyltransferase RlmF [Sansalvadorimonas sp. 2012CJ34-2]|uniref:Ribosomal RNA large subunit methyltransferase F n=2 Tax=Parendozoicomonas callyspongiae TaxID=2942213 RepID=A0ABT0PHD9_9GAMM|nr:23S rRNA (adenine(1618)-N(6))-methyltransferase RlmF [Sansalvadorimonas sp. 2012CJ34-2]